ncbi:MAG: hypothetical protein U9O83_02285 [Campylobacterota bacterium]|nr:hypothetical protein [Campylobacterota bacterium]
MDKKLITTLQNDFNSISNILEGEVLDHFRQVEKMVFLSLSARREIKGIL